MSARSILYSGCKRRGAVETWEDCHELSRLDRAALDANYNLRAAVPEHPVWFERYATTSAGVSGALARASRPALWRRPAPGDRSVPAAEAPRPPLLVFIHGGYWQAFGPKDFSFVAERLVEAGAAVAMVGYDLAPAVDMDTIVSQIRHAIAWLHRNADAHGFDPGRICLAGHSAGGHLAAMALATDWTAIRAARRSDQRRMRDQRRVRPRADPPLLSERRAAARCRAGAPQQSRAAAAADLLPGHGHRGRAGDRGIPSSKAAPMPMRCAGRTCRASWWCSRDSTTSPSSWR